MKQKHVEVDKIRIWDFYLTFPNEARKIIFPRELAELKKIFKKKEPNPYEDLIDPKRILDRMKSYQMAALKCLASYNLIDQTELTNGIVSRTNEPLPGEIRKKIADISTEKENTLKLIIGFKDLPLYGRAGLKYRTGLIEFKYDSN